MKVKMVEAWNGRKKGQVVDLPEYTASQLIREKVAESADKKAEKEAEKEAKKAEKEAEKEAKENK